MPDHCNQRYGYPHRSRHLQPSAIYTLLCSLALSDLLKGVFTIYDSCYSDWVVLSPLAIRSSVRMVTIFFYLNARRLN